MKKFFFAFIFCLFAVNAFALSTAIQAVCGASSAASCTTAHVDNSGGLENGGNPVGSSTANYWTGQTAWNPGENISICKVRVNVTAVGSPSGRTWYVAVYTLDGTSLNVLQGTSDGQAGNNAANDTNIDFVFSTPVAVTNGTDYAVVLYSNSVADASNYYIYNFTADGALDGTFARFNDDKTQNSSNTRDMKTAVYK